MKRLLSVLFPLLLLRAPEALAQLPTCVLLDDFNRLDSTNMGALWTEAAGDFRIESNHASSNNNALMTFAGATTSGVCVDTFAVAGGTEYTAIVLRHADLNNNVFIKVQRESAAGLYDRFFFRYGLNGMNDAAWPPAGGGSARFFDCPFASARLFAFVSGTTVFLYVDTNFDNVPDQFSSRAQVLR